jgi:hypothetical protein
LAFSRLQKKFEQKLRAPLEFIYLFIALRNVFSHTPALAGGHQMFETSVKTITIIILLTATSTSSATISN